MVKHYVLTLNGSAQQLNTALDSTFQGPGTDQDQLVNAIYLQPDGANAGIVYVGDKDVSSTDYGFRMEIPASTIPQAPFAFELSTRSIRPSHLWVKGTNNDKLHITLAGFTGV